MEKKEYLGIIIIIFFLFCFSTRLASASILGDPGLTPGQEDPSILAWRLPWTEESGRS